jgi:hypothetical protein
MPSEVIFRRATQADAERFYSGPPRMSLRGWVAEKNGEIVGIGGVYYANGVPIAFSEITDAFRENKKDVAKGCRILMELISKTRGPVYAVANPDEPTAARLLARLGWEPTGRDSELGEWLVRG